MRLLITGSTGFVGRHLVERLRGHHKLFCLVRRRDELPEADGCVLIERDFSHPLDTQSLPHKLDAIIHLAQARVPFPEQANEFFYVTTGSTQGLLEYGRRIEIKHFIYASSGSIYGFGPKPFREDDPPCLLNFYAVNKYISELLVQAYASYFRTSILRIFFPYGPEQVNRRIPMIAERVIRGQSVKLVNGGQPRINPIFIDDLVRVIEAALQIKEHVIVNVAGDEVVSMKELAELVSELIGEQPIFENTVDPAVSDMIGDNGRMHRLFPQLKLLQLKEGLRQMLRQMVSEQHSLDNDQYPLKD